MFYRKRAADIWHFGLVLMRDFKVREIGMLEWVHVKPSSLQWEGPEDMPFNNPLTLRWSGTSILKNFCCRVLFLCQTVLLNWSKCDRSTSWISRGQEALNHQRQMSSYYNWQQRRSKAYNGLSCMDLWYRQEASVWLLLFCFLFFFLIYISRKTREPKKGRLHCSIAVGNLVTNQFPDSSSV